MKKHIKTILALATLSLLLAGCNGGSSTTTSGSESSSSSSSSTSTSGDQRLDPGDYYNSISDSLTGNSLKTALNSLNSTNRKRTVGYAGFKKFFKYSEIDWKDPTPSGKMVSFYNNVYVANEWDNEKTWNREHVWPNSLGGGSVEADAHMVRPCDKGINGDRGNQYYGKSLYDAGQFVAEYRGIAARIIFYCAIANTSLKVVDTNSGDSSSMGKLSDLLEWNLQYAPSKSETASLALRVEQNRNVVIQKNASGQGNRNPFIDHPEYACKIWGSTNSKTKQICGM